MQPQILLWSTFNEPQHLGVIPYTPSLSVAWSLGRCRVVSARVSEKPSSSIPA